MEKVKAILTTIIGGVVAKKMVVEFSNGNF